MLRFFAFRHIEQYTGRLDNFLDNFLRNGNSNFSSEVLSGYEKVFYKNIELANKLFGDNAFRQYREYRGKFKWTEPTRTAYDPMMRAVTEYKQEMFDFEKNTLDERSQMLMEMYKSKQDDFNGKKQGKIEILQRTEFIKELLNKLVKGV